MAKNYYREESRGNWYSQNMLNSGQLQTGCLMRIADSLEEMEKSYRELINDRDHYKSCYSRSLSERARLEKRNAGLKGQITRMKEKK